MKTRIITSIIALAVFAAVLIAPPIVFTGAMAVVIFIMLYECYSAAKADISMKCIGICSAILLMAAIGFYGMAKKESGYFIAAVIAVVVLHMILTVFEHGKNSYKTVLANGFLTIYAVVGMGCIWLAKQSFGISNMLLVFICAWSTDTFAYFTGRAIGKHKLIPHVSPNKTVEGAVGGVIGAMVICIVYLLIINYAMNIKTLWNNIYIEGAMIGLVGGVLSQLGDLTASAIKRDTGVKDFGWIFPGHGGFMDRFDSVMFIAPMMYGVMMLITLWH